MQKIQNIKRKFRDFKNKLNNNKDNKVDLQV